MARGALKPPSMLGALLGEDFANRTKKKVTFVSPEISRSSSTTTTSEEDGSGDDASTSDIDSTYAVVGSDEDISETDEDVPAPPIAESASMATTGSSEVPEWTREEDRAVLSMKMEGRSWANIGKELSRGKKEVQRHYKALSSDAAKLGLTVEKLARIWAEESDEAEEEEERPNDSGKDKRVKRKDAAKARKDGSKHKEKRKTKATKINKRRHKPAGSTSSSSPSKEPPSATKRSAGAKTKFKSKSKSKGKKNKPVVVVAEPPAPPSSSSSSTSRSSSRSSSSDEDEDPNAEHRAQQRYLYHEIYGAMFPGQRALRPDAAWSADDCRTLAVLEARRRHLWWEFLQSDFYNATGRVVDAEVLRAKFEEEDVDADAEEEEEEEQEEEEEGWKEGGMN
ncbi:hypothetical protein F5X96DRAFT_686774 [Biscogniauxia mediterranea]|nr:hypothetical protein F5X96DRAFT_686774 [Biscogniauxia mediterranea]